jgi:hypothetical protein
MTMEILVARSDPLRLPPPEGDLLERVPHSPDDQAATQSEVSTKQ